jgi:hypothetical protein
MGRTPFEWFHFEQTVSGRRRAERKRQARHKRILLNSDQIITQPLNYVLLLVLAVSWEMKLMK